MNTANTQTTSILVWDWPTRIFHWSLALSFLGAYLTAESEVYRNLHVLFGYSFAGLIVFRLLWGLVGSNYARFTEFVRGPGAVGAYLKSLFSRQPKHYIGHNPAGALAILLLLGIGLVLSLSGWAHFEGLGGDWLEEVHEVLGNLMLALVAVHILGVILSSRLHGENLAKSMLTGRKRGPSEAGIASARPLIAALLLTVIAGFWTLAPQGYGGLIQPGLGAGTESSVAAQVFPEGARQKDRGRRSEHTKDH